VVRILRPAADRDAVTTSGDTQALPRIPVPGSLAGPLPTVALTIAVAAPQATEEPAPAREQVADQAEETRVAPVASVASVAPVAPVVVVAASPAAPAESHDRIYEEAMATIAALASSWSSAVQLTSGRHRAAA
jgi:hypothetical protein